MKSEKAQKRKLKWLLKKRYRKQNMIGCHKQAAEQDMDSVVTIEDTSNECEHEESTILIDDDDDDSVIDLAAVDYDGLSDVIYLGSHFNTDLRPEVAAKTEEEINRCHFSFRLYESSKQECSVVLLQKNSDSYPIVKSAKYLCIWGRIRIFGYDMTAHGASNEQHDSWTVVNAASISAPTLYVENVTSNANSSNRESFFHYLNQYCSKADAKRIKSLARENSACFILHKLAMPTELRFAQSVLRRRTFLPCSNEDDSNAKRDDPHEFSTYRTDCFVFNQEYEAEMGRVLASAQDYIRNKNSNFVYAVTGLCNTGKSTFLRLAMNRALAKSLPVYHLECDCGQTEFSLPGCLSLTKVTEPVFGDSFTHLRNSEACYYFGHVTPANRISDYLEMIHRLKERFDRITATNEKALLMVNTNGWVTGPGFHVLRETLLSLDPNHVTLMHYDNWTLNIDLHSQLRLLLPTATVLHHLQVTVGASSSIKIKNGRLLRELCIIAYFGKMFQNLQCNLNILPGPRRTFNVKSLIPYKVDWRRLRIRVLHGPAPPVYLLSILNANLVALCRAAPPETNQIEERKYWMDNDQNPAIFTDRIPPDCIGFGMIRSINPDEKSLYVLSPLSDEEISGVDVILKGVCDVPVAFIRHFNMRLEDCKSYVKLLSKNKKMQNDIAGALEQPIRLRASYKKMHKIQQI